MINANRRTTYKVNNVTYFRQSHSLKLNKYGMQPLKIKLILITNKLKN